MFNKQELAFFDVYCKKCFQEKRIASKGYFLEEYFFKNRFAVILKCPNCGFEWGIDSGNLSRRW